VVDKFGARHLVHPEIWRAVKRELPTGTLLAIWGKGIFQTITKRDVDRTCWTDLQDSGRVVTAEPRSGVSEQVF